MDKTPAYETGQLIWFTGLSAAGKTTIATAVARELDDHGHLTHLLDGDELRTGLSVDLGYSPADRRENVRRADAKAQALLQNDMIVLAALISPFRADRQRLKGQIGAERFIEIYCECTLAVCEARDPKNLYRRAWTGELKIFTGIDAPYEPPKAPDLVLRTDHLSVRQCVEQVLAALRPRNRKEMMVAS